MDFPESFVWTRYGTEAGEPSAMILRRKERERAAAGGLFLWGIGNSIAPGVRHLLSDCSRREPVVVFSPMRSPAKHDDVSPATVMKWRLALGLDRKEWAMPRQSLVTSRMSQSGRKRCHYALVCRRHEPIVADPQGIRFSMRSLRNVGSGKQIGASQVTSVVRRVEPPGTGEYVAVLVAALVYPFVLELHDPVELDRTDAYPRRAKHGLLHSGS